MLNLFSCQRLIAPRCRRRTSLHRLAAVGDHRVPDDEGGHVRTQPQDGRGDLLGRSHPADRLLRDHRCAPLWGAPAEPLHHLGVDNPMLLVYTHVVETRVSYEFGAERARYRRPQAKCSAARCPGFFYFVSTQLDDEPPGCQRVVLETYL